MIDRILRNYARHGIKLQIEAKKAKNINFRLKPINEPPFTTLMTVSYPTRLPKNVLIESLTNRLTWAIDCQQKQFKRQENTPKKANYYNDIKDLGNLTLDSEIFYQGQKIVVKKLLMEKGIHPNDFEKLDLAKTLVNIYKIWLIRFIQIRQTFWQDKVGKTATKITPYTMKTRWGSCSTQAKTIRLSIWLAQFPPSCADYVMVHELCHLHEANHSARFWAHVERVMPDYKIWHDKLKYANQNSLQDDI